MIDGTNNPPQKKDCVLKQEEVRIPFGQPSISSAPEQCVRPAVETAPLAHLSPPSHATTPTGEADSRAQEIISDCPDSEPGLSAGETCLAGQSADMSAHSKIFNPNAVECPANGAQGEPATPEKATSHETAGQSLPVQPPAGKNLNASRVREQNRRARIVAQFEDLMKAGLCTRAQGAAKLGLDYATVWRYMQPGGTEDRRSLMGRNAGYMPSENELAAVREIFMKLDSSKARGRGLGSSRIVAYRFASRSEDPRISEQFKGVVLKQRKSKSVPKSWLRLLDATAAEIARGRDKNSTLANWVSTPRNRTIIRAGEEQTLRAGMISTADDGTLNFYAWIPWPFGGDPCSEKFGVKLGRWQLLAVVDVASEFCPVWHIVARNLGSYRGEDSGCLLGAAMLQELIPELWLLERGSWESKFVRELLSLVNVPVRNAWHSKQKNTVERFFNRLWTPASLIPGHVGRDRARFKQVELLAMACQAGRRDPRDYFLSLEAAEPKLRNAIEFANTEPIVSHSGWGQWTPQERYLKQIGEAPRAKLPADQAVFFSREQKVWTIRGHTAGGNVSGPLVKFPTYFQCAEFAGFDRCKVKCYFDPYADEVRGTIVLQHDWAGFRKGHVIADKVPALELPPQAVLGCVSEDAREKMKQSLAIRKAISKSVLTKLCHWRGAVATESRDGLGNIAVRDGARICDPQQSRIAPAPEPQPRHNRPRSNVPIIVD